MNTIDLHEFTQISNERLKNAEVLNKTARNNKYFRLNSRRPSMLDQKGSTVRPNSINLTPRELETLNKRQDQSPEQMSTYDVSLPKLSSRQGKEHGKKIDRTYL
jgi:hypothetical protein